MRWQKNGRAIEPDEYGPVYMAIERALWALGPALLLIFLLNFPAMQTVHQQLEAGFAADIAAENLEFCSKWGMPAGSAAYVECVRDLVAIRQRAEQRLRDQTALDF